MIAQANQVVHETQILKFQQPTPEVDADERLTLELWLKRRYLPDSPRLTKNSIKEIWTAEKHWRTLTGDPDIRELDRDHLVMLRDRLLATGNHANATINKIWRTIKSALGYAEECDVIHRVPSIGRGMKSRLVDESPKQQRETVTQSELASLLRACKHATYPQRVQFPAPKLWAAVVLMFDAYGARTRDFLEWLTFSENVRYSDRLISFAAMKTRKLQALPLIPVTMKALRAIQGFNDRVFPGFNTKGCYLKEKQKWKRGYYATWRSEIVVNSNVEQRLCFKNFRESMITRMEGIEKGLGAWAAGHHVPGVTAQFYDRVDDRIRAAFDQVTYSDEVMAALDQYGLA